MNNFLLKEYRYGVTNEKLKELFDSLTDSDSIAEEKNNSINVINEIKLLSAGTILTLAKEEKLIDTNSYAEVEKVVDSWIDFAEKDHLSDNWKQSWKNFINHMKSENTEEVNEEETMYNKEKLLEDLSTNLFDLSKVKANAYRGKVFIVADAYRGLEKVFKTKRGAKGYIDRMSNYMYYDEATMEMCCSGNGLSVIELSEEEIPTITYEVLHNIALKNMYNIYVLGWGTSLIKDVEYYGASEEQVQFFTDMVREIEKTRALIKPVEVYTKEELIEEINYFNEVIEEERKIKNYTDEEVETLCTEGKWRRVKKLHKRLNEIKLAEKNSVEVDTEKNSDILEKNSVEALEKNSVEVIEIKNNISHVVNTSRITKGTMWSIKRHDNFIKCFRIDEKGDPVTLHNEQIKLSINLLDFNRLVEDGDIIIPQTNQIEEQATPKAKGVEPEAVAGENKYPKIDINDIEKYTIDKSISDRENNRAFFRSSYINHTEELQEYFLSTNKAVEGIINNPLCTEKIRYGACKYLQSFKEKYYKAYKDYLIVKGNTPSWMETGRGNLNSRRYSKAHDRVDKKLLKVTDLVEKFNNKMKSFRLELKGIKEGVEKKYSIGYTKKYRACKL